MIERLGSLLSRSTPQKARADLLNRLDLAGALATSPRGLRAVRIVAGAVMAAVGLLIGLLLGSPLYAVISLAVGLILGYYLPVLWLKQKVDARRADIRKDCRTRWTCWSSPWTPASASTRARARHGQVQERAVR